MGMCQYDHDIPHSSGNGMLHIRETNHIQEINYIILLCGYGQLKFKRTLVHSVIYVYVCIYV